MEEKIIEMARVTFTTDALPQALKTVKWAASEDPSRPALNGTMCLEITTEGEANAVSTNGCIMAVFPLSNRITQFEVLDDAFYRAGNARLVFTVKELDTLLKQIKGEGPVTITFSRKDVHRTWGEAKVGASTAFGDYDLPVVDAIFPNYRTCIPQNEPRYRFTVSPAFREAFKIAELNIKEHTRDLPNDFVRLDFSDDGVKVYPSTRSGFAQKIPADPMDDVPQDLSLTVSMTHIHPMLNALPGQLTCEVTDPRWPLIFRAENGAFAVYMPCRTQPKKN